jgi:hypothetical protein
MNWTETEVEDHPMSAFEFRLAIQILGLSQEKAGVWCGYSPRSGQRWAAGHAKVPIAVTHLLRMMVRHRYTIVDVERA